MKRGDSPPPPPPPAIFIKRGDPPTHFPSATPPSPPHVADSPQTHYAYKYKCVGEGGATTADSLSLSRSDRLYAERIVLEAKLDRSGTRVLKHTRALPFALRRSLRGRRLEPGSVAGTPNPTGTGSSTWHH